MQPCRFSTPARAPALKGVLLRVALVTGMLPAGTFGLDADRDHDGVPDSRDMCPHTAQLKKLPVDFSCEPAVDPERMEPDARSFGLQTDSRFLLVISQKWLKCRKAWQRARKSARQTAVTGLFTPAVSVKRIASSIVMSSGRTAVRGSSTV